MHEENGAERARPVVGRRRFLRIGSAVGIAGIAGCSSGDEDDESNAETDSTPEPTTADAGTPDGTATPVSTPSTPTETATPTDTATPTATETPRPASFSLSMFPEGPVTESETVDVTVTIENQGEATGSGTVRLMDGMGTELDTASVTVSGGQSRTVTLSWETAYGDAGEQELTVELGDETASSTVTIEEGLGLSVVDTDTVENDDGESVLLNATIENDASISQSGLLVGKVHASDEDHRDYRDVTLEAGEREEVRVKVTTNHGGSLIAFTYDSRMQNAPPSDVDEPNDADYLVVMESDAGSVSGDSAIEVTADVENLSDESRSATLGAEISSDSFDAPFRNTTEVSVSGGQRETHSVEVEYDTDAGSFVYHYYAWIE